MMGDKKVKKTLLRILNVGLIVLLLCGNVFQLIRGGTGISSFTATAA